MIKWNRVNLERKHPLMPEAILMQEKAVNRLIGLLLFTYIVNRFQTSRLDTGLHYLGTPLCGRLNITKKYIQKMRNTVKFL